MEKVMKSVTFLVFNPRIQVTYIERRGRLWFRYLTLFTSYALLLPMKTLTKFMVCFRDICSSVTDR
jgi:hypothetical protein